MSTKDTSASKQYPVALLACMIPDDCMLPGPARICLLPTFLDTAWKSMTNDEIELGGKGEEPYASQLREISCGRCNIAECIHNRNPRCSRDSADPLVNLKNGQWHDRIQRGDQLIEELKPRDLDPEHFEVTAFHTASRRNPRLFVTVKRRSSKEEIVLTIEVGERKVAIGNQEYALLPFESVRGLWTTAVKEFTTTV